MSRYISKPGTEIQAVFNGKKFGELHMIKYAIQRDVSNVHVMGVVDAVAVAKGKRQVTGACVFAVFERDTLLDTVKGDKQVFLTNHEITNYASVDSALGSIQATTQGSDAKTARANGGTLRATGSLDSSSEQSIFASFGAMKDPTLSDQIPPFDIVLVAISEQSGHGSRMIIHGVQFNSDQGGSSVDDLLLERQLTFLASRISPWSELSELANGSSVSTVTG